MAPTNFEKNIQKKLQERELTPSDASWDRLHAMLEQKEKPVRKSFVLWYSAAAVILIAGLMAWLRLSNENLPMDSSEPVIVWEEETPMIFENETEESANEWLSTLESNNEVVPQKSTYNKATDSSRKITENKAIAVENEPKSSGAAQENSVLKSEKTYVKAETLLAWAQDKDTVISTVPKVMKNQPSISAEQLLTGIEKEMDVEYRENIFERTYKNLKQIKEVIVHRNDQPKK